ncbi:SDR family NAD(P)-dependent oxidoreductase [Paraburkholderia bannensis]|uniref:SDR family NAD(P)-dependent oxidoreductase n=1 Tax=Paraburkholderia bannensis TaxID=765414 RepID=UPI002ABE49EA|nr:SDR family NAD(P)-dependent oxidoreductase [Paraburkholderia bannensis]
MTASRGTAVVSGALSLIGLAYADYLATNGHDLILIDQDRASLNALAEQLTTQTRRAIEVVAADRHSAADVAMIADKIDRDASVVLVVSVTEEGVDSVFSSAQADSLIKSAALDCEVSCSAVRKFSSSGGAANLYRASVVVTSAGRINGSPFPL